MRQIASVTLLVCFSAGGDASAEDRGANYQLPPQVMIDLVDAPPTPRVLSEP